MTYPALVRAIGKRYGRELETAAYPHFAGTISDYLDAAACAALPDLYGEYVIGYTNRQGVRHQIRVYFDDGMFEATGMPGDVVTVETEARQYGNSV